MSDLIDRQAAIDVCMKYNGQGHIWACIMGGIRKLPSAQPQWTPVSERLPRQGQEVICQCRANMINVLKLDADGDWYQDANHIYMGGFVIAWMPLPEPYREEE